MAHPHFWRGWVYKDTNRTTSKNIFWNMNGNDEPRRGPSLWMRANLDKVLLNTDPESNGARLRAASVRLTKPEKIVGMRREKYQNHDHLRMLQLWDRQSERKGVYERADDELALSEYCHLHTFLNLNDAELASFELSYMQFEGETIWPRRKAVIIASDSPYIKFGKNEMGKKFLLFPDSNAALRYQNALANTPRSTFYSIIRIELPVDFYGDIDLDGELLRFIIDHGIFASPNELMDSFIQYIDLYLASMGVTAAGDRYAVSDSSKKEGDVWVKWSLHFVARLLRFRDGHGVFAFTNGFYDFVGGLGVCNEGCPGTMHRDCQHRRAKIFSKFLGVLDQKVYSFRRQMRQLYSTKHGKERYLRCLEGFNDYTTAISQGPVVDAIAAFCPNPRESPREEEYFDLSLLPPLPDHWTGVCETDKVQITDFDSLLLDAVPGVKVFRKKKYAMEEIKRLTAQGKPRCQIVAHEYARKVGTESGNKCQRYLVLHDYDVYQTMLDTVPEASRRFHSVFIQQR